MRWKRAQGLREGQGDHSPSQAKQTRHREINVIYCLLLTDEGSEKQKADHRHPAPPPSYFPPMSGAWSVHSTSSLPELFCSAVPQ